VGEDEDAGADRTALYRAAPRRWWADINLHLVTWARTSAPIYPLCGACAVLDLCPRIA